MIKNETLKEMVIDFPELVLGAGIKNTNSKDISREIYFVTRLQLELFNSGCVNDDNDFWDSVDAQGVKRDDPKAILTWVDGDFGKWVFDAVKDFQCGHVDWDGNFLEPDGIVGPKTWWALYSKYSDAPEIKANPDAVVVVPSSSERKMVLDTAYKYLGVVEKPKGSNTGPIVDTFTNKHAWAWCAMFTHYVFKQATGRVYVGDKDKDPKTWTVQPSVANNRLLAKKLGIWKEKGKADPELGDIYSIDHGGGKGHTGLVSGIKRDAFGKIIGVFTISGNESDSVKEGYRPLSSSSLVGFIDPYKSNDTLSSYDKTNNTVGVSDKEKTT